MMSTIYLVVGTRGEYSDRSEWFVKAFRTKERATEIAALAKARGVELYAWRDSEGEEWKYSDDKNKPRNEHDPQFNPDYTGTDYYVSEVELEDQ